MKPFAFAVLLVAFFVVQTDCGFVQRLFGKKRKTQNGPTADIVVKQNQPNLASPTHPSAQNTNAFPTKNVSNGNPNLNGNFPGQFPPLLKQKSVENESITSADDESTRASSLEAIPPAQNLRPSALNSVVVQQPTLPPDAIDPAAARKQQPQGKVVNKFPSPSKISTNANANQAPVPANQPQPVSNNQLEQPNLQPEIKLPPAVPIDQQKNASQNLKPIVVPQIQPQVQKAEPDAPPEKLKTAAVSFPVWSKKFFTRNVSQVAKVMYKPKGKFLIFPLNIRCVSLCKSCLQQYLLEERSNFVSRWIECWIFIRIWRYLEQKLFSHHMLTRCDGRFAKWLVLR